MSSCHSQILLGSGALLRQSGERVELTCPSTEDSFSAEGVLAQDLLAVSRGGVASARLAAVLGDRLPAFLAYFDGEKVELTGRTALRLGGFDTLFMELTGQCNERCSHCYAGSGPEVTSALEREVCDSLLEEAAALEFRRVQFTGGDPLLCRFLPELVEKARTVGIPHIEIYTNGLALGPTLLDALAPHAPSFAFSFYSADPDIHDGITRVPGSQVRTLRAMEGCLSRGLELRASIVVMEENAQSADETIRLLKSKGISSIACSGVSEVGRGQFFQRPQTLGGSGGGHRQLEDPAPGDSLSEVAGMHSARRPTIKGTLAVSSSGDVYPCIFNRKTPLGSVRSRSLREIVENPELRRSLGISPEKSLSCPSCRLTDAALRRAAEFVP
jgi:MoaA/NifB/PqqE/SkfB family radical SAM enzyme